MKRWTRKLLAGLLSFGMLLQVESPLSALAAETPTVESSITVYDGFSRLYTSVTYVLNRYTDGSVRWEDDKNPWDGVDVSYDTSSNTYVFSGTLSVPAGGTGHTATLICSDPQNDSIKIDGGDGVAVNTSLQIGVSDQTRGAKNVTVLANNNSTAINGSAAFDCYGDVTITNPSGAVTSQYDGIVVYDYAKDIIITGKSEAPLIGGSFSSYSSGNITIENPDGADVRTNLSISKGAAEVKLTGSDSSGLVLFRDSSLSTFKIKAKTLTMENKSGPVGPVEFTGTDTASAYRVAVGESESSNTQTALTGTTYSEPVNAKYLNIQPGTPENTTPDDKVTNYGITVTMNHGEAIGVTSNNCGNILGDTYTNGKLTYDPESHTLTGTGTFGELKINITAADSVDVKLSNDVGATTPVVDGALTINNANNITVTPADGTVAVNGKLTVDSANNVTVVGNRDQTGDSHYGTIIDGDVDITCSGDVLFENKGNGDVIGGLTASTFKVDAHDVTVKGNSTGQAYPIFGSANIESTGDVVLENKGSGKAVRGELKYTPTHTQKYEIKTGAAAASAETFYTGESGTGYTGAFNDPYISIAPASSGDTTPDDTGTVDSGSDAGGAVAAVLVGGAAVWGGYEIATRVILHNILPEGAAIPANRGQLALLVWNNAGRPAPVNEPAFADMDDADMAKAAQWCVEQGIMEAKTAETFKPEGWTPKLKVIEVWNKAFPKQ
ncbi:hypothetical protein ACKXF7_01600 [Faecalibacterium sp. 7]|uniref:hypothetical protein n=1 Tax=Faecalibacterium sp. 7 TaxID=3402017 RepID=UPI003C2BD276